ncbi:MAG: hypothetical protein ABSH25_13315 [Syntrophorhabdales bacterium]|jgi:ankyrin repeat protein
MKDLYDELRRACYRGNEGEISRLLAAGADVNHQSNRGHTALLHLMRSRTRSDGVLACLDILLDAGAEATKRDWSKKGQTPLIAICSRKAKAHTAAIVDRLIRAAPGVLDNLDRRLGSSALAHVCIRADRWSDHESRVVRVLLSYGAETNTGDFLPLVLAAESRNWPLTEMLLYAGADPSARDCRHRSAKYYFWQNGWEKALASHSWPVPKVSRPAPRRRRRRMK